MLSKCALLFLVICWVGEPVPTQRGLAQSSALIAQSNVASVRDPAFDVVSIRPARQREPDDKTWGMFDDRYGAVDLPLWATILQAYLPLGYVSEDRLVGAPRWVKDENFTIRAKVAAADLPEWQREKRISHPLDHRPLLEGMLQQALADRCGLVVHRIPGEGEGFALVVSKNGPSRKNLKTASLAGTIPTGVLEIADGGKMLPIMSEDVPAVKYFQASMKSLAAQLSFYGAPVEDRTHLDGRFDFVLTRFNTTGYLPDDWDMRSLGLNLVRIKVSVDKIVVDHIERPTPN